MINKIVEYHSNTRKNQQFAMTPEQQNKLAAIKAALKQHIEEAEKATPGPWTPINNGCSNGGWRFEFITAGDFASSEAEMPFENAAFVASARTMSPLACRMALYAIETMEYDKQEGEAGAYNDLVSILSIWEGGQP